MHTCRKPGLVYSHLNHGARLRAHPALQATQAWAQQGHPGWHVLQHPVANLNPHGVGLLPGSQGLALPPPAAAAGTAVLVSSPRLQYQPPQLPGSFFSLLPASAALGAAAWPDWSGPGSTPPMQLRGAAAAGQLPAGEAARTQALLRSVAAQAGAAGTNAYRQGATITTGGWVCCPAAHDLPCCNVLCFTVLWLHVLTGMQARLPFCCPGLTHAAALG